MIDPELVASIVAGMKLRDGCTRPEPPKVDPRYVGIIAGMKQGRKELTQERLKALLDYDPVTGLFHWKIKPTSNVMIGDVAGYQNQYKYIVIMIDGKNYPAHRLAWLYVYGRFPKGVLDHIDRIRANNKLDNLVEATRSVNTFNARMKCNNSSGYPGVDLFHGRYWRARIGVKGDNEQNLGYFKTFEEAVAARQAAEVRLLGCLADELQNPINRRPIFRRRI